MALQNITNVVVLGHSGSGKTSIIENMAYRSKLIEKPGSVLKGTTILDTDPLEIEHLSSNSLKTLAMEWNGVKLNVFDTPGYFDFEGDVESAINVCENALIVTTAKKEVNVGLKKAMKKAENMPKIIYISHLDNENYSYKDKLEQLKATFGKDIAPIQVPIMENNIMKGYVNVAKMEGRLFDGDHTVVTDIPEEMMDEVMEIKEMIDEAVGNTSDEMLEKYFSDDDFTKEEISVALRKGVMEKTLIPVLCGTDKIGITIVLNSMVAFFTRIDDYSNHLVVGEDLIDYDTTKPTSLYIYKTKYDAYMGKLSYFKVLAGVVKPGQVLVNHIDQSEEKVNKIYVYKGKGLEEVKEIVAGDVGILNKMRSDTNDTLSQGDKFVDHPKIVYRAPNYLKGVKTLSHEDKFNEAITKLLEEDLTLNFEYNKETSQLCLSGLGQVHLDTVKQHLLDRFKVEVEFEDLIIPYRSSIDGTKIQRERFKKQSGGHGQFAEVEIEFSPSRDFDNSIQFDQKVFGGAIPKTYFSAVEKGVNEACIKGPIEDYLLVGVRATLLDGKYHNVDSSEMAFKTASYNCLKSALPDLKPYVIEPYYRMKVYVEEHYLGDVMSDLQGRQAIIEATDSLDGSLILIDAVAPLRNICDYAIDLKTITQAEGFFTIDYLEYRRLIK